MSPRRKRPGHTGECLKVGVPAEACHVRFGQRTAVVHHSSLLEWRTVRGDQMILDFDANGRVLGIELIGNKPCQEGQEGA